MAHTPLRVWPKPTILFTLQVPVIRLFFCQGVLLLERMDELAAGSEAADLCGEQSRDAVMDFDLPMQFLVGFVKLLARISILKAKEKVQVEWLGS